MSDYRMATLIARKLRSIDRHTLITAEDVLNRVESPRELAYYFIKLFTPCGGKDSARQEQERV